MFNIHIPVLGSAFAYDDYDDDDHDKTDQLASRHSPRYRKIATTTTTTITATTTFPFLLNLGLMDFDINFGDGEAHVYVCPLERGCSIVSEARQVTLDSWKFSMLR